MARTGTSTEEPKTLTDSVYAAIRTDIIEGVLEPDSKLRIEGLKKNYAVGATPIREALSRLTADGFVHTEGQRGFRVTPISVDDLLEVTEMRLMLELRALERSVETGDEDWESRVVTAFFRLSKVESDKEIDNIELWEERNREFHEALLSACTSQWLLRFYGIIYDQHKRYRNLSLSLSDQKVRNPHQEHIRIYKAALDRNAEKACEETRKHIQKTADISLKFLQQMEQSQQKA